MFCQKCGFQLPDGSSFCTSCGAATVPVIDYNAIQAQPSPFGSYMSKVMKYIGGIFKSPSKNVQTIASEKAPVWIAIELVKFISVLMAMILLPVAAGMDWVGAEEFCSIVTDSIVGENFGLRLLFALLIFFGTFGIHFLMTRTCAVNMTKLDVPATVLLNICAISSALMIITLGISIVASFIWFPLSILIFVVGAILCAVMYTESIRASGIFGSETVWKNAIVLCVTFAVSFLLILITTIPA